MTCDGSAASIATSGSTSPASASRAFSTPAGKREKLSAVQYVRFPLAAGVRARIVAGAPLAVVVDHPAYVCEAPVPEVVRASLSTDLTGGEAARVALERVRDG